MVRVGERERALLLREARALGAEGERHAEGEDVPRAVVAVAALEAHRGEGRVVDELHARAPVS